MASGSLVVLFIWSFIQAVICDYPDMEAMDMKSFIGDNDVGCTAAYGDVNSDKHTDVFTLKEPGTLSIYLGSETAPALNLHQSVNIGDSATSVVPLDFNGDEINDILVTYKDKSKDNTYTIAIYWGVDGNKIGSNSSTYEEKLYDEPLVLDANGDMIPDLFVVHTDQSRAFLLGQKKKEVWTFVSWPFPEGMSFSSSYFPHSHAFIDLTDDGSADLFITGQNASNKAPSYEVWKGTPSGLKRVKSIDVPIVNEQSNFGHSTFADFTGNAKQDIALSTCELSGDSCTNSKILIFTDGHWHTLYQLPEEWSFPNESDLKFKDNTLHIADVNLDSYPDVMTIVKTKDGNRIGVIFYNIPCESDYCGVVKRQLGKPLTLKDSEAVVYASFYDFQMDGTMDVIITTKKNDEMRMKAYKNMIADDVTFLRVQVLTGMSENAVYGINVPGPQITYETTNLSGGRQLGRLGQLSQSAHMSLQLPYVIFGLGRLANFVDYLTVSIPVPLIIDSKSEVEMAPVKQNAASMLESSEHFKPLNQTWPMLIPNSQLYVIPHPTDSPSGWSNKMLVTPGQNVVTTGIVLLGTMGVLMFVTIAIHWLEKRDDRQEKIQEAHRFHFDAM